MLLGSAVNLTCRVLIALCYYPPPMKWYERPFFRTKGTILEHTIDIAFVALCARAATWVVKLAFPNGWFPAALEFLDEPRYHDPFCLVFCANVYKAVHYFQGAFQWFSRLPGGLSV